MQLQTYPLVSIILPTYNTKQEYLEDVINSIDSLSYSNFEVIIVDDASTNSDHIDRLKKLEQEKKRYPLKIYFQEENTGPGGSYNKGISLASGEYFKTCGHDDILPVESIEKHVQFMETHKNLDIVLGDIEVFGMVNDSWPGMYGYGKAVKKDLSDLTFHKLFTGKVMMLGPCALMRSSVIDKIGNFDKDVGVEDWDLFLRAIDNNISFGYIEEVIYRQRKHDVNLSKDALYMILSRYKVIQKYITRPEYSEDVKQHHIDTLEQLMSLSKKDFWNTLSLMLADKNMGKRYIGKLCIKKPTLVPSLMFRFLVGQNSAIFSQLKSLVLKDK